MSSPVSGSHPPLTVYTIRLTTGLSRGAALSDPYAAVNVCLVGAGGTSALYRISPVNDPMESRQHTMEICEVSGRSADVPLGGIYRGTRSYRGATAVNMPNQDGGAANHAELPCC